MLGMSRRVRRLARPGGFARIVAFDAVAGVGESAERVRLDPTGARRSSRQCRCDGALMAADHRAGDVMRAATGNERTDDQPGHHRGDQQPACQMIGELHGKSDMTGRPKTVGPGRVPNCHPTPGQVVPAPPVVEGPAFTMAAARITSW